MICIDATEIEMHIHLGEDEDSPYFTAKYFRSWFVLDGPIIQDLATGQNLRPSLIWVNGAN